LEAEGKQGEDLRRFDGSDGFPGGTNVENFLKLL
jgi:hypothetical protein